MAENNPAMMMMTAVLGQTVRLLPIIGEADKEATYPSLFSLHSNMMMMMLLMMVMEVVVMMVILRRC